jgi:predicted O-methyltransferase YrrM
MSHDEPWADVDRYLTDRLVPSDEVLDATLSAAAEAGLPAISVSPMQGKLLHVLARLRGARAILEIGTLAGYSTIWLARALPEGGTMITLEYEPRHAEVARANIARAGLADRVDIRVGAALDTLSKLAEEGAGPFDMVFIDADRPHNREYVEWALKLTRPGSVIMVDNVVRNGAVADPASADPSVLGVRGATELMASDPRLDATVVQTVGAKGYDGFALAVVVS